MMWWGVAQLGFKLMAQFYSLRDYTAREVCDESGEWQQCSDFCVIHWS